MLTEEMIELAARVAADYPYVRPWTSQHGKTGWRFRRPAKNGQKEISKLLPGDPFTIEFDDFYNALVEGRPVADRRLESKKADAPAIVPDRPERDWVRKDYEQAKVIKIGTRTFAEAWLLLRKRPKWKDKLEQRTRENQTSAIESFLNMPIDLGGGERNADLGTWRDVPVADMRRRNVEDILEAISVEFPWKAKTVLVGIKKLINEAIRHEWLDANVAIGVEWEEPATRGWLPWEDEQMAMFEAHWPIGTAARTAYALALFLGNRRSDVALLRWDQLKERTIIINGQKRKVVGFAFVQYKNRKRKPVDMFLPLTPMLSAVLAPLDRTTETVLVQERNGRLPYSIKSLSKTFAGWAKDAGLPAGYTLHGLRKALGGMIDDAEATGGQNQDILGHASAQVNDRYRVSRKRARNAVLGMDKVVRLLESANDDSEAA
jgi:integrase